MDSADTIHWKIASLRDVLIAARNYHSQYHNQKIIQLAEKEIEQLEYLYPEAQERDRIAREKKESEAVAKRERQIELLLESIAVELHREELIELLEQRAKTKIPLKRQVIENRIDQSLFSYRFQLEQVKYD